MRPERWWSVIFMLGLFMALSPLSAQAGPNRPFAPQPNRQAFTPAQPGGHANTWNRQPHQWQQPRGQAYGWHGQNRQWQQPRGHAYGWNNQHRQHHQWQQPRGHANAWNRQPQQWQQHRNTYGRNDPRHQWQQPPTASQHHNPGSPYYRAGYPGHPASPTITPNPSGYSHSTPTAAGRTGTHPGFHPPGAAGDAPLPKAESPSGVI